MMNHKINIDILKLKLRRLLMNNINNIAMTNSITSNSLNKPESKVRLMLVDDHKLFRCGIKSLFEKSDGICVIAEAENGKEGISKILAQNPDVVLLDLELGDINGLELMEKVISQRPNVKFISKLPTATT